jgi:hypothetical protein
MRATRFDDRDQRSISPDRRRELQPVLLGDDHRDEFIYAR